MAMFQCLLCGETFGNKSSHYCIDKDFLLVKKGFNDNLWVELIDWKYELITNNSKNGNNCKIYTM